ncbi:MAG: NfeD family protein [Promethearchaeota archaeon]
MIKSKRILRYARWKRKRYIAEFLIVVIGLLMTTTGFFFTNFYDIFFSICLGLFIGGIIMSIISTVLAEISTHDLQATDHIDHGDFGHVDHIDHGDFGYVDHIDHGDFGHVDHIDHGDFGHVDHIDHGDFGHVDHVDHGDFGQVDHIDHIDHVDHIDHGDFGQVDHIDHIDHADHDYDTRDSNIFNETTPTPFMLIFSTSLLLFGISGILFYYIFDNNVRFLIFFAAISVTFLTTKLISTTWKKIAKSRFYDITATKNLIGQKGVIVLDVDNKGGVVKIKSNNPMKFEKIHVKPLHVDSFFEKGEEVYICDIKDGFLLVDKKLSSIRYRRR